MVSTGSLRPPALPTRSRTTDEIPRSTAAQPFAALAARILGRANPRLDGILRAPRRRGGDRLSGRRARLGGEAVSASRSYDIVIIGSGAGGGTVAQELAPLVRDGVRILVLEKGPRFADQEFTGRELEMADALYQDGGAFLTRDGTMTLAFASAYGGSTVVYTGTSLTAPLRVIRAWGVPGLEHADLTRRSAKYAEQNNVHALDDPLINDNNRLFVEGGRKAGYLVEQFPVNVKGCRGSSLCNLGCPNQAKQGTNRVQLPRAERAGVEVVTRAEVLRIEPDRTLTVRVSQKAAGTKGAPSEWAPGDYAVRARIVVAAAGAIGTSALLLRSPLPAPRLHLPPGADPGRGASAPDHERRGTPQELLRRPWRVGALRARDLHVLSLRHREEPDGLRGDTQRHHARVPAAPDDPDPGVRSRRLGQSHRGESDGEPDRALPLYARDHRRPGAGDPRGGPHLLRRRGAARACARRPAAPRDRRRRSSRRTRDRQLLPARHVGRLRRASHGWLRNGTDRSRLRDRRLGTRTRSPLAPGGGREPLSRLARDQPLPDAHGPRGPRGRGGPAGSGGRP